MTRGTKRLIDLTIEKNNIDIDSGIDTTKLVNDICIEVENRYPGNSLDYNLRRMGLEKNTDVKNAVDTYLYQYFKRRERLNKKEGE